MKLFTTLLIFLLPPLLFADSGKNIFTQVSVSNKTPYEGEHLTYTLKLFSTKKIETIKVNEPRFKSFIVTSTNEKNVYFRKISGRNYRVIEISYVLIPTKTGPFDIEKATISFLSKRRTNPSDTSLTDTFFNRSKPEKTFIVSNPIHVNVKPLPVPNLSILGEDFIFSGLVGQFQTTYILAKKQLTIGESTTFTITIKGAGNILHAICPELLLPEEINAFYDDIQKNIQLNEKGFFGTLSFNHIIAPLHEGDYSITLPPFNFFDPSLKKYVVNQSVALPLHVIPSPDAEKTGLYGRVGVPYEVNNLPPLFHYTDTIKHNPFTSISSYMLLIALPAILYILTTLMINYRKRMIHPSMKMARKSYKALKKARKSKKGGDTYYKHLHSALTYSLLSKTEMEGHTILPVETKASLVKKGIPEESADKFIDLLLYIETLRFKAPDAIKTAPDAGLFSSVIESIGRIEKVGV